MANFKGVIKCTKAQYTTLKNGGSIIVSGKTITYDPDILYLTPGETSWGQFITISSPSTATSGTLSENDLATLQASTSNYIVFADELYRLNDQQTTSGYLVYAHTGCDSTNHTYIKCITITISTRGWVLTSIEVGTPKAKSIEYTTVAPTSDNTDGLKIVVLTDEPSAYYDGYYYIITEE